ncbi:MAG: peptidoglycan DD-metalloendopeptidase family protein [Rikenellaceae bacterium]
MNNLHHYLKFHLTLILISLCSVGYSQRKEVSKSLLMAVPIDTIDGNTASSKIVVYSNGTWDYLVDDAHRMQLYQEFGHHWDNNELFAYKDISFTELPAQIELKIVDDLDDFHAPILGARVTSKYGIRNGRDHKGIDLGAVQGTPLYATFDGKVRYAKWNSGGYGYLVIIRCENGLESWYGHLCTMNVKENEYVKSGQVIGYVGNTGRSYGNHLHYELRYRDQSFDPDFLIDFETGSLRYANFVLDKSFLNINSRASEILEDEIEFNTSSAEKFANAIDSEALKDAGNSDDIKTAITQSNAVYHTVKSGDTLGAIARKYGTTVAKICSLNNIKSTSVLRLKQRLRVR